MFLVFNKEKIYTYLVSIMTVILLFFVASNIDFVDENTIETSVNEEKVYNTYKDNYIINQSDMQNLIK